LAYSVMIRFYILPNNFASINVD